jgi:hypothetical protein
MTRKEKGMTMPSDSQQISRAKKRRLHLQHTEALARRQRQREQQIAAQRKAIRGIAKMREALEQIEFAQAQLQHADATLRALLTIAPLAQAYAQFQNEGGVGASDWGDWLDGKSFARGHHASKQHLRIVSVRHAPSIPRRPIGRAHIAEDELVEDDATDLRAEYYGNGDGPEAA